MIDSGAISNSLKQDFNRALGMQVAAATIPFATGDRYLSHRWTTL
jgi:hypothetical protein